MEQTDCECPCECPLELSSENVLETDDDISVCSPFAEELSLPFIKRTDNDVPSCFQVDCSLRKTER